MPVICVAKRLEISRRSILRAFKDGVHELGGRYVRVNCKVVDYRGGASKHRTLGGYQQIDMRPREACVRSRTAKGAVVKSPEMILPKNALSSVDESTKLLDETYWCRSIIVCVATLKPPYRT